MINMLTRSREGVKYTEDTCRERERDIETATSRRDHADIADNTTHLDVTTALHTVSSATNVLGETISQKYAELQDSRGTDDRRTVREM